MNHLYLLVNFFTISIPLLFSFHPRIRFYRYYPAFFAAAVLVRSESKHLYLAVEVDLGGLRCQVIDTAGIEGPYVLAGHP